MKRKLLALLTAVLTFAAYTTTAAACSFIFYQPEVPEALREE